MSKNLFLDSNLTHKDGYQNGKEKVTKRKERKEATKLKAQLQLVPNRKMYTMLEIVQGPNRLLNKQKEEDDEVKIGLRLYIEYHISFINLKTIYLNDGMASSSLYVQETFMSCQ